MVSVFATGCFECVGAKCRGADGPNSLFLSDGDDYKVPALGGNDRVFGGGGDDTVIGNGGEDYVVGNEGNDMLADGGGPQTIGIESNEPAAVSGARKQALERIVRGMGVDPASLDRPPSATFGPDDTPVTVLGRQSGKDRFFGGPGDDLVIAAGGGRELLDCGPGLDRFAADEEARSATARSRSTAVRNYKDAGCGGTQGRGHRGSLPFRAGSGPR